MNKKQIVWLQIFYWSFNFIGNNITPYFFFPEQRGLVTYVLNFTYFITEISTFYLLYLVIIPKVLNLQKLYSAVLVFLIAILSFGVIRYGIEEVMLPLTLGFRNYNKDTGLLYYLTDNIYNASLTVFIAGILWVLEKYGVAEHDKKQLLIEKKQAELQALKTQINPHFIFNSLNNIYSLVYQKSDKALPAIEELGQLLRYSTKDLEKDTISLDKEIGYIDSLIALEKLRIRNPQLFSIEKDIQHPQLKISPMLLVPFVENAFKHGDFRNKGFDMKISDHGKMLHFYLLNYKAHKMKDTVSGIGIQNVKKRLEILYPKHQLEIKDSETEFRVNLKIDLRDE